MSWQRVALIGGLLLFVVGCTSQVADQPNAESAENGSTAETVEQEASPAAQPQESGSVIKSGTFVAGEHPTQGTARIVERDGKPVLELDQEFQTSDMGPDLVVVLHRSADVLASTQPPAYSLNEGDYVILAPLQKFKGAQSYTIPENVNLEDYQSAVIWCRRFNATFGTAQLSS